MVGFLSQKPRSQINLLNQMASQVVFAYALYSDLHDDLDIMLCFFELHDIGVLPMVNMYAPVDLC